MSIWAKRCWRKRPRAILQVMERLDDDFDRAVNAINAGRGKGRLFRHRQIGPHREEDRLDLLQRGHTVPLPASRGFTPRGPRHRAEGRYLFHHLEQRGNGRGDKGAPVDKENGHTDRGGDGKQVVHHRGLRGYRARCEGRGSLPLQPHSHVEHDDGAGPRRRHGRGPHEGAEFHEGRPCPAPSGREHRQAPAPQGRGPDAYARTPFRGSTRTCS